MNFDFEQRVVLVTGGSRGIGRAAALAFGAERARVAITYRRDRERAEQVVTQLREMGTDALAAPMDLAEPETIRSAVATVLGRWDRIDALVNNAVEWGAVAPWEAPLFEAVEPAKWRRVIQDNVEGTYTAIQAVLPAMRRQRWGRIVNISSTVAVDGMAGAAPYASAKAALHGLTRTLALELARENILSNVVMPGLTLTEANLERIPVAVRDELGAAGPLGRLLAPAEVAAAIVFLASAANTALVGEIVRASGGAS